MKKLTEKQKEALRPKPGYSNGVSSEGGGSTYKMVRSKILIGPVLGEPATGLGRVITRAREELLQKLAQKYGLEYAQKVGDDYNIVAMHREEGAHIDDPRGDATAFFGTRAHNTKDSNQYREKVRDRLKSRKQA